MTNRSRATVRRWATALLAAGMGLAGSASATLMDRGGGLIYDDVLNITWLQDASYAKTSGFDADGFMSWADANAWATGLSYFDSMRNVTWTDWRLPWASVSAGAGPITTLPVGQPCTGAGGADELACRDDEMAYMFYYNLDGTFMVPEAGTQIGDGVTLNNIEPTVYYWSGTEFDSGIAWNFTFGDGGLLSFGVKSVQRSAWAVRPGDVAAAPEPASLLLIGAGMLALGWNRRKWRRR